MDSPSPRPFQCAVIQEIASPPPLSPSLSTHLLSYPSPFPLSIPLTPLLSLIFLSFRTSFLYLFSCLSYPPLSLSHTFSNPFPSCLSFPFVSLSFPTPTPASLPILLPPLSLYPSPSLPLLPFSFLFSPLPPPLFSLCRDSIPYGVGFSFGLLVPFPLHTPFPCIFPVLLFSSINNSWFKIVLSCDAMYDFLATFSWSFKFSLTRNTTFSFTVFLVVFVFYFMHFTFRLPFAPFVFIH